MRQRVSRGTLSRDEILATTLSMIEADPVTPITMERVATELGTRPMSLYTHVRNRDDLINGAFERSMRAWRIDVPEGASWEDEVRVWCRSLRDHSRRYSPLIREMARSEGFQPALLEKVAILARSLRRSGLEGVSLVEAIRWIPQTVLGAIVLELSRPTQLQSIEDETTAIFGGLGQLDEGDREEWLAVLPYYSEQRLGDLFDYSVDRLIDGLRTQAALSRAAAKKGGT